MDSKLTIGRESFELQTLYDKYDCWTCHLVLCSFVSQIKAFSDCQYV